MTSLRKDNEVKLEDEIKEKSVTSNERNRESIVELWTAISRQRLRRRDNKQVVLKNPFSLSAILLYEYSIDSSVAQLVRAPH